MTKTGVDVGTEIHEIDKTGEVLIRLRLQAG